MNKAIVIFHKHDLHLESKNIFPGKVAETTLRIKQVLCYPSV